MTKLEKVEFIGFFSSMLSQFYADVSCRQAAVYYQRLLCVLGLFIKFSTYGSTKIK